MRLIDLLRNIEPYTRVCIKVIEGTEHTIIITGMIHHINIEAFDYYKVVSVAINQHNHGTLIIFVESE